MKPAAAISDEYISAMADGHLDSSELGTALNSFNADEHLNHRLSQDRILCSW